MPHIGPAAGTIFSRIVLNSTVIHITTLHIPIQNTVVRKFEYREIEVPPAIVARIAKAPE